MKIRLLATVMIIAVVSFFALFAFFAQPQPVSYADSVFESCYDDDECTIDRLYEISQTNSSQTVLLTIDDLVDLYVDADFYCHPNAHHLGEFLFGYVGRDLNKASKLSDYRCASGIMHGLVENTIQIENMLDGKSIESVDIQAPCKTIGDSLGEDARQECIHGMGHSLVKIYDYDTRQATKRCSEFDDWREVYMCNGGLFMQNIDEYAQMRGGDFSEDDLYYPCNQIDGAKDSEAATLCYRYQANYFLIRSGYDLQLAYSMCSGIKDENYIPVCYKGISAHLTTSNFYDLDKTQLMCLSTPEKYREQCVIGAIESLTRFVSDQKAQEFCQRLDGELQDACQTRMNSLLNSRYE